MCVDRQVGGGTRAFAFSDEEIVLNNLRLLLTIEGADTFSGGLCCLQCRDAAVVVSSGVLRVNRLGHIDGAHLLVLPHVSQFVNEGADGYVSFFPIDGVEGCELAALAIVFDFFGNEDHEAMRIDANQTEVDGGAEDGGGFEDLSACQFAGVEFYQVGQSLDDLTAPAQFEEMEHERCGPLYEFSPSVDVSQRFPPLESPRAK